MKIHGSVTNAGAAPQDDMAPLPQWNESATEHAAALVQATLSIPSASHEDDVEEDTSNDYPVAMDDFELGDFLMDAMEHTAAVPMDELAACDALHMCGDLPHPPMNLPPP